MPYECVAVKKREQIATVKINRPNKLNALNIQTVTELTETFEELKADEEVRVVVLTGAGEKAFAAGADITELTKLNTLEGLEFSLRGQKLCSLIENLGKPVIGAINGFALGGGCELAMSCTMRIAVKEARIGQPEVNLGTIPGYGGTQRLARLIPRGIAMELVITGRVLTADEALELGLVNKVVSKEEFNRAIDEVAKLLVRKPPFAVRACVDAILHGTEMSFEDGLRYEATLFAHTCGTEDMKEGTQAFLEKREPKFTGK